MTHQTNCHCTSHYTDPKCKKATPGTFNQANCSCTRDNVDASCEVHGGSTALSSTHVDNGQDFGWLDEILYQVFKHGTTYGEDGTAPVIARAAIIEHFTAQDAEWAATAGIELNKQVKQHQKELLRARIDSLSKVRGNADHLGAYLSTTITDLQADLAKLEGESA